jgi:hypothetical protein
VEHDEAMEKMKSAVLAAGRATLPSLAKALLELGAGGLDLLGGTGTQRLQKWVEEEIWDAVLRRLPEVEARVADLQRAGVPINVSDFVRVVEQYARAWRDAADAKKRKLLEDAFVRSFDRELYESSLLNVLWDRLDRLTYGDLFVLRRLLEVRQDGEGLVNRRRELHLSHPESLNYFHATNLVEAGLCSGHPAQCLPTELGKRVCELAWDQLPEPGAEAAGGEK